MSVWLIAAVVCFMAAEAVLIIVLLINRTKRIEAEKSLQDDRRMLYTLMDNLHEAVFFKDRDSKFIRGNFIDAKLHGFSKQEELIGKTDFDIHDKKLAKQFFNEEQEMMEKKLPIIDHEALIRSSTGEDQWVRYSKVPVEDGTGEVIGLFGIAQDITSEKKTAKALKRYQETLEKEVAKRTEELAAKNEMLQEQLEVIRKGDIELKKALEQRDLLLREIHHRVKNNLQTINSLIYLQLEEITDEGGCKYLRETLGRIKSMSLVHEMLYQEQTYVSIGMEDFLRGILLGFTEDRMLENIDAAVTAECSVRMGIDDVIPFGLIMFEIFSYSIAHLSSLDRKGTLSINLKQVQNRRFMVTIYDNGQENSRLAPLSSNLVDVLVEQIRGEYRYRYQNGNVREIIFDANLGQDET